MVGVAGGLGGVGEFRVGGDVRIGIGFDEERLTSSVEAEVGQAETMSTAVAVLGRSATPFGEGEATPTRLSISADCGPWL